MCHTSYNYAIQKGGQHFISEYRVTKIVHPVGAFYRVR
jgi:hypothetical protein